MYKIFTLLFALVCVTATAQKGTIEINDVQKNYFEAIFDESDLLRSKPQAEVFYPTVDDECSDQVFIFTITERWGFLAGNNEFTDLGKGQVLTFEGNDSYTVIGGIGYFGIPRLVGDGELTAEVYSLDADGAPNEVLVTSAPKKVSELMIPDSVSIQPTLFLMPAEGNMELTSPKFMLNIDFTALYESGDTVGLYATDEGCGDGGDSWEEWSDGSWHTMSDPNGWESDLDFIIAAIVEFTDATSTDAYLTHKGLTLFPAFPNPTSQSVQLKYSIEHFGSVKIDIFDSQGKLVEVINQKNLPQGIHFENVDLSRYSSGMYYYQIATNKGRVASKFTKD